MKIIKILLFYFVSLICINEVFSNTIAKNDNEFIATDDWQEVKEGQKVPEVLN